MGKMCSLSRHTTSLLSGIATLECKMVKMEIKELGHCSLVSSFQSSFFAICARSVDQTTLELLAFLQRVTCLTTLVSSLEHFCLEFWRKFNWKKAKWNGSVQPALPRMTSPARRHVSCAVPGSSAHTEALENPAIRGPRWRHCALEAVTLAWRPRPVPRGRCALASGRTAFLHWPLTPPHVATAPAGVPVGHNGEAEPPLRAYKTLPFLFPSRARATELSAATRH
jgi:hypothetical protein